MNCSLRENTKNFLPRLTALSLSFFMLSSSITVEALAAQTKPSKQTNKQQIVKKVSTTNKSQHHLTNSSLPGQDSTEINIKAENLVDAVVSNNNKIALAPGSTDSSINEINKAQLRPAISLEQLYGGQDNTTEKSSSQSTVNGSANSNQSDTTDSTASTTTQPDVASKNASTEPVKANSTTAKLESTDLVESSESSAKEDSSVATDVATDTNSSGPAVALGVTQAPAAIPLSPAPKKPAGEFDQSLKGLPSLNKNATPTLFGIIVVDNDQEDQTDEEIVFEATADESGKTAVKTGAKFPVVISSEINSKHAKKGDAIEAKLKYDLKIGDRLIAPKGSQVVGHVNYVLKARTILGSIITVERFYRNSGCLGVQFDEIINHKGEHLPLVAQPARTAKAIHNKGEGRELGVNHRGQVVGPWSQQLRYKAVRYGLNFALAPAGVFSFGAMPVALGVLGAANPSFAFSKPVGLNVRHRRIKGFFWGFLSGVPGSWLIEDTTVRGQEAIIKPGDEFTCEFRDQFTGEPASDASLLGGGSRKVEGEVINQKSSKKSSSKKK